MATAEEKALYVGEAGNCLTDGTPLVPGETIALVTPGEAGASDVWEPVSAGTPASDLPRNAPPPLEPPYDPGDVPDEAA